MEAAHSSHDASPAPETISSDAAASHPPRTPHSRWSHDDDKSITVAQTTHDYTQRIFQTKPASAQWVRGLAEGEDNYPTGGFRRRKNMNKWEELDDTPDDVLQDGSVLPSTARRPWLFYVNLLGVLYICLLAFRMASGLHKSYRLDFPTTERQLQTYGRRYGENGVSFLMRVVLPMSLPHGVGAGYVLGLSYKLGGAAHHFVALWGVGLALISLFAAFTQCSVLFGCCNLSDYTHRWECEVPYVFHQVCSAIRLISPVLGLWCVAPVVDGVRRCGWRWRCILALPCIIASVSLGVSISAGEASQTLLDVTYGAVLLTWPLFLRATWKQPRFLLVRPTTEKPHEA